MKKMEWTQDEERLCCKICCNEYVVNQSKKSIEDCIKEIKGYTEFQERSEGSISMKIQNIKSILEELGIKNTIPKSILPNASKENRKALLEVLEELNVIRVGEK